MFRDRFRMSRTGATLTVMLPVLAFSAACSLSFGSLAHFHILGLTIFDFLDKFTTDILLPIVSLGVCVYLGWFSPSGLLRDQLSNHGTINTKASGAVTFIIRYVAPALIVLILVSNYL